MIEARGVCSRLVEAAALTTMAIMTFTATSGLVFGIARIIRQPWGGIDWILIVGMLTTVIAIPLLTFGLGSFFGRRVLAPVTVLAWWVLDGMLALRSDRSQFLVPRALFESIESNIYAYPHPSSAIWMVVMGSAAYAVVGILLIVSGPRTGRASWRHRITPCAVVVAIVAGMVAAPVETWIGDASRYREVVLECEYSKSGEFDLCLHPAHGSIRDDVTSTIDHVTSMLPEDQTLPGRFQENTPVTSCQQCISFWISDRSSSGAPLASQLVIQIVRGKPSTGEIVLSPNQALIATAMMYRLGYPTDYRGLIQNHSSENDRVFAESVAALTYLTDAQFSEWLARSLEHVRNGKIAPLIVP